MLTSTGEDRPTRPEHLLTPRLAAQIERLDLRSHRFFSGKLQGERRSKRRGRSAEFDDFRNYVRGDDLRFIDWNAYARFQKLFIKVFLEEEDLSLQIAVDASSSMDTGSPNKLLYACRLAFALAYIGLIQNNRVGLTVFGAPDAKRPARWSDRRGRFHAPSVGKFLIDQALGGDERSARTVGPAPDGNTFNEALSQLAHHRVGSGVLVVISDFLVDEGYDKGLKSLAAAGSSRARGFDVFCLQTLSPAEIDPSKEVSAGLTGDLRFTDIESGRASEVTMSGALLEKYRERYEAYQERLASFCAAREMNHMLLDTSVPVERVILDRFRACGMLV